MSTKSKIQPETSDRSAWIHEAAQIEGAKLGLRQLETEMAAPYKATGLGIEDGDHRDVVRRAADVLREHGFVAPMLPGSRKPLTLRGADAYIGTCKTVIWNPDRPAYWYWRMAGRESEALAILRSALFSEGLAELGWVDDIITTGQHRRDRASAISYLDRLGALIAMFHRNWAI